MRLNNIKIRFGAGVKVNKHYLPVSRNSLLHTKWQTLVIVCNEYKFVDPATYLADKNLARWLLEDKTRQIYNVELSRLYLDKECKAGARVIKIYTRYE